MSNTNLFILFKHFILVIFSEISGTTDILNMDIGGAFEADFNTDKYVVSESTNKLFPLRVRLIEDRIMTVEKKYFCDRTTEKTVTVVLKDALGNSRNVSTRKVSCQYDLVEIFDQSFEHEDNVQNNTWNVEENFPSEAQLALDPWTPKIYRASAWAVKDETLKFRVKFSEGSHVKVSWKITVPNDEGDDCLTDPGDPPELASGPVSNFDGEGGKACVFPFRYDGILYYGCTMLTNETNVIMCATSIDSDFNALQMGNCNAFCHRQCKRYYNRTFSFLYGSNFLSDFFSTQT